MSGVPKVSKRVARSPPSTREFRFNVSGAARGKLGPSGIGVVL